MSNKRTFVSALLLGALGVSAYLPTAQAGLITYQFQAEYLAGTGPFTTGTVLTATFDYNPDVVASAQDIDGVLISPNFANYGFFSFYDGGISNFSATVGGYNFGVDVGGVLVGDGSGDPASGFFGFGNGGSPGWSGFSLGGFNLTQFVIFTVGNSAMLTDQSLLPEWYLADELAGGVNSGVNLSFRDQSNNLVTQFFSAISLNPVPVPEPGSLGMLGAGLLALALVKLRRAA